ncbi:hypothetical protein J7J26_00210 [Candidatus Micrarchaeota archaeon]|nr:hypothetical protein [Candidatus Micrarchaeota archaeon]
MKEKYIIYYRYGIKRKKKIKIPDKATNVTISKNARLVKTKVGTKKYGAKITYYWGPKIRKMLHTKVIELPKGAKDIRILKR